MTQLCCARFSLQRGILSDSDRQYTFHQDQGEDINKGGIEVDVRVLSERDVTHSKTMGGGGWKAMPT